MRRMALVVSLFCMIPGYAKSPVIPEALLNAKTAMVKNGGADAKDFEKFRKLIEEWGRFQLVEDQKSADIVMMLSRGVETRTVQTAGINAGVNSVEAMVNYLKILDAKDGTELWTDSTPGDSKEPRLLVNNLKNKLKKK